MSPCAMSPIAALPLAALPVIVLPLAPAWRLIGQRECARGA